MLTSAFMPRWLPIVQGNRINTVAELHHDFLSDLEKDISIFQSEQNVPRTWKQSAAMEAVEDKQMFFETDKWEQLQRSRAVLIDQRWTSPQPYAFLDLDSIQM